MDSRNQDNGIETEQAEQHQLSPLARCVDLKGRGTHPKEPCLDRAVSQSWLAEDQRDQGTAEHRRGLEPHADARADQPWIERSTGLNDATQGLHMGVEEDFLDVEIQEVWTVVQGNIESRLQCPAEIV